MRYFLDTEYNGWRGDLLALALVPEDGGEEFYVTLESLSPLNSWVEQHVRPYMGMVPPHLLTEPVDREAAARLLSSWLLNEVRVHPSVASEIEILADWPEDLSQFCMLLTIGPGLCVDVPPLSLQLLQLPGFSTAANSKVPHNALHDARALRDHVVAMD